MANLEDRLPGLPRYVRINTIKTTRNDVEKRLKETGHFHCPDPKHPAGRAYFRDPWMPDLLVFKPKGQSDISRISMVASGEVVVQQLASCFPALALAPPPGATAIDGCAAPGNKTSHLAALMHNRGRVYAFEVNERRCKLLREMMTVKGASIVVTKHASFLDASPTDPAYAAVTHVLLDPSCSSSGMSLTPETDPARLRELADNQLALVLHAMRFPAVEAVVYSTCSIHQIENEEVVRQVLRQQRDFTLEPALPFWPRRGQVLNDDSGDSGGGGSGGGDDDGDDGDCNGGDGGAEGGTVAQAAKIAQCVVRCSYPEDQTIGFFLARFVRRPAGATSGAARSSSLRASAELTQKLEVLAKAREKRAKQSSKMDKRQRNGEGGTASAASGASVATVSAAATTVEPSKRAVPSWRLERDARKKQKRKHSDA